MTTHIHIPGFGGCEQDFIHHDISWPLDTSIAGSPVKCCSLMRSTYKCAMISPPFPACSTTQTRHRAVVDQTRRAGHTHRSRPHTRSVGSYRHPYIATDCMYELPELRHVIIFYSRYSFYGTLLLALPWQPRVELKTCT